MGCGQGHSLNYLNLLLFTQGMRFGKGHWVRNTYLFFCASLSNIHDTCKTDQDHSQMVTKLDVILSPVNNI